MAGTDVDLAADAKPGLHLMSLYAFERMLAREEVGS